MISVEEFTKIWNEAHGIEEVVNKTQMKLSTIYARARRYRERGIELKRYRLPIKSKTVTGCSNGDN